MGPVEGKQSQKQVGWWGTTKIQSSNSKGSTDQPKEAITHQRFALKHEYAVCSSV
jgi:hypothetical protein